jgi:outer membrane lipoprotein SlyB
MEPTKRSPLHPLLVVAAIAVIVFSVVGVGAITGLIPTSRGTSAPAAEPVTEPLAKSPADGSDIARAKVATASPAAKPAAQRTPEPAPAREAVHVPPRYEPAARTPSEPPAVPPAPVCRDCGSIESIQEVKAPGEGSGVGAVAGGVAGAVLGNQVGGGRGRDLATVVGAVGGAVAGHQVEKRVRTHSTYQITVRMDDGSLRTVTESTQPAWRTGDRVRVQGDRLATEG